MDDEDGKAAAAAAEGSYSPTSFAPRPTRPRRPAKVLYIYSPCRWWVAAPKKIVGMLPRKQNLWGQVQFIVLLYPF